MTKYKAIVVTTQKSRYETFLRENHLNTNDYILINDKINLYSCKDTIAFLIFGWQDVFGYDMDFNHTEAVMKNHNVDIIVM